MIIELQTDLKTKCCTSILTVGTKLKVISKPSKNTVYVGLPEISGTPIHKVKISSLKMAIRQEEIENLLRHINEKNK